MSEAKKKPEEREYLKATLTMAWPAVVESFFVAFAGLIDSLMVSSLGAYEVAAVGLTAQPKFMGMALFIAMGVSVSAIVARRKGEGNRKSANCILITALGFVVVMAAILSVVFVLSAGAIMRLCGSTAATHDSATLYFQIIMGGMIFNCIQFTVNSAQRGAGNTRITMRTNVTSNTINVIFNYLLIQGNFGFPAMGIAGAALATVLGTAVSCIMSIRSVTQEEGFLNISYLRRERIRPSAEELQKLIMLGYGIFLEQILLRIGMMATAIMAAKMGDDSMAAHQVGMNFLGLTFAFGDGLQSAAVALIGMSLGKKEPELAKRYAKTCQKLGAWVSIAAAILLFGGTGWIMGLFFDEERIVQIGVRIMWMVILVVLFQVRQVIYMGCLRGAGDTLYTAMISTVSVTLVRTAVSFLCGFILGWGVVGVWMGILADQIGRLMMSSLRFKQGKWMAIKV